MSLSESVKRAIKVKLDMYFAALNKGDVDKMVTVLAEDGTLVPPMSEPIKGQAGKYLNEIRSSVLSS